MKNSVKEDNRQSDEWNVRSCPPTQRRGAGQRVASDGETMHER